jgi:poly(A) polymerase
MGSSEDPIGQLSPQEWLVDPATVEMLQALTAEGADVRFVGGCVRDSLLRRPVHDIDMATPDRPEVVMSLLAAKNIKTIPTGIDHGTVTAIHGGRSFEITTLRKDVETDGRHARVVFTQSWREDAARRDFTINTLSADGQGRIWDPYNGLADLGGRRIRFVGNAERRIEEDVLRLLRFFRFQAHYGLGPPDPAGLAACRRLCPRLVELSPERVTAEMIKLLAADDPAPALTIMLAEGILDPILPEIEHADRLRILVWLESRALIRPHIQPDPWRRLACVISPIAGNAAALATRLHLSRHHAHRISAICEGWGATKDSLTPPDVRKILYEVGADIFRDQVLVGWSEERRLNEATSSRQTARWVDLLDQADQWQLPVFPLRGQDLLDLGGHPGPQIGLLLAQIQNWWQENDFRPSRQDCLDRLKTLKSE